MELTAVGIPRDPAQPRLRWSTQLVFAWCGPLFAFLFAVGFVVLARFIPALPPSDTAAATVEVFRERGTGIKIGLILVQVALGLWLPFGVVLAERTRMIEGSRARSLTYLQLLACAASTTQLVLMTVFWGVAAFRAGETSPWATQLLNDIGWFFFLFCFVPLTMWVVSTAPPILQDTSDSPDFPRWVGFLSLWVALMLMPGASILIFFKEGILAWNGLLPLYIPLVTFFIWFGAICFFTLRAVRRDMSEMRDR